MSDNKDLYSDTNKIPKKANVWTGSAILSYIFAVFVAFKGFEKISFYDPDKDVNVYVGGDAYNYIINAQYATAFFVLAGCAAIVGTLFLMIRQIDKKK